MGRSRREREKKGEEAAESGKDVGVAIAISRAFVVITQQHPLHVFIITRSLVQIVSLLLCYH